MDTRLCYRRTDKTMKASQTYTAQFRAEAVKLVLEQPLSQPEAAQRLGIPKGSLSNGVVAAKKSRVAKPAPGESTVTELRAENARPRRKLARVKMEREIAKRPPWIQLVSATFLTKRVAQGN